MAALSPSASPPLFLSDVPRGANTFGVSGSSEVKIYMVYDPARVAEPTGRAHWPLDANVDVVVVADTVSKDMNDLKVSLTPAGSYPNLSHLRHLSTETQTSHTPIPHSTWKQPVTPQIHATLLLPQTSVLPKQDSMAALTGSHRAPAYPLQPSHAHGKARLADPSLLALVSPIHYGPSTPGPVLSPGRDIALHATAPVATSPARNPVMCAGHVG